MLPKTAAPRIVVLKGDKLYGDLISRHIKELWRNATVLVFQLGFDALDSIQAQVPDLFITGVKIDDMDGLEHLEPFLETSLPVLVLTSRKDASTFDLLRSIRYDGLYDGCAEGLKNLPNALQQVIQRRHYVSPSMLPHLKRPKSITLDTLTDKEQLVLSVIGDGSDDQQAVERLGLSPYTVNTHRKAITAKLKLHPQRPADDVRLPKRVHLGDVPARPISRLPATSPGHCAGSQASAGGVCQRVGMRPTRFYR